MTQQPALECHPILPNYTCPTTSALVHVLLSMPQKACLHSKNRPLILAVPAPGVRNHFSRAWTTLWPILPRKTCLLTGCNKQHISSSSGFPDYQAHSTSQSALKCDTWILYLEFLDIIFELEMTGERKRKNKACGHKMLYQFRRKIPRKLKNDIDERWNQEVRQ